MDWKKLLRKWDVLICKQSYVEGLEKEIEEAKMEIENLGELIPKPKLKLEIKGIATNKRVFQKLKEQLGTDKINLTDDIYYITTKEEVEKLIEDDSYFKNKYEADKDDCDDGATYCYNLLKKYCGLIIYCSAPPIRHAVAGFLDKDLKLWIIEIRLKAILSIEDYYIQGQKPKFIDKKDMVIV